jgi:hypothetical protein
MLDATSEERCKVVFLWRERNQVVRKADCEKTDRGKKLRSVSFNVGGLTRFSRRCSGATAPAFTYSMN